MNEMCKRLQKSYDERLKRAEFYAKDIYSDEATVREYLAQAELLTGILGREFDIHIYEKFVEGRTRIMDIFKSVEPKRKEYWNTLQKRQIETYPRINRVQED